MFSCAEFQGENEYHIGFSKFERVGAQNWRRNYYYFFNLDRLGTFMFHDFIFVFACVHDFSKSLTHVGYTDYMIHNRTVKVLRRGMMGLSGKACS